MDTQLTETTEQGAPQDAQSPFKKVFLLGIIGAILLIVLAIGIFLVSTTTNHKASGSTARNSVENNTFEGKNFSFTYPTGWKPTEEVLCCGKIWESVKLGIAGEVGDQFLGYASVGFDDIKKEYTSTGQAVTIGGKSGMKWVSKTGNGVSYDYYTSGMDNQGSFGLHVTVAREDKSLESQLDSVISSLSFK